MKAAIPPLGLVTVGLLPWLTVGDARMVADLRPALGNPDYADNPAPRVNIAGDDMLQHSEFFFGALQRPLLQIVKPQNGQVLDSDAVEIEVEVSGYDMPSVLHDSRVCLGIASQGERVLETCFDQTPVMSYVVTGLQPARSYMLRVVLFERSSALAVSVRSFRVGAVSLSQDGGQGPSPVVTIQTALQLAVDHHNTGAHAMAEDIYRKIIEQYPQHPDALHLLGLVLYQKGDPAAAISFIERAIHTNGTFAAFHNTMGECLRAVGRLPEAISHFQKALSIAGDLMAARFNMGLAYQQLNDWPSAVRMYEEVSWAAIGASANAAVEEGLLLEARTRQCDLLQAMGDFLAAQQCWEEGLRRWPTNALMLNELGNVHTQMHSLGIAGEFYEAALHQGYDLAELNIAIVRELEGNTTESMLRYERVLSRTDERGLPDTHIRIKMATVLPRVMPDAQELLRFRRRFADKLDALLGGDALKHVDNSEPTHLGFSTGLHLGYHGMNNVALKTKLHRVYSLFCPALMAGTFLSEENIILQSYLTVYNSGKEDNDRPSHQPAVDLPPSAPAESSQVRAGSVDPKHHRERPVRIGFVSRHFRSHAVGILAQGVIARLPRPKYRVSIVVIEPSAEDEHDAVAQHIISSADEVLYCGTSLNMCADNIRRQGLDVLVYPEIGLDPMSYFLAFARLAPVQAVWFGHPDTTGIPTIDYFLSSEFEVAEADRHYSEKLHRMRGFGAYFFRPPVSGDVRRQVLREKLQKELNLPSSVHFYLCPQALVKFHPAFDDVLIEILTKDKLAVLLLLNGSDRYAWSKILLSRIRVKLREQIRSNSSRDVAVDDQRVLFYSVSSDQDMQSVYMLADVVLDTFPTSGYISSIQAFSVGAPVVTLPGDYLAGRFTLGMYRIMGIHSTVASSPQEYVRIALKLAHNQAFRSGVVSRILANNYKLFEDGTAISEWDAFLSSAIVSTSRYIGRMADEATEANNGDHVSIHESSAEFFDNSNASTARGRRSHHVKARLVPGVERRPKSV